MDRAKSAIMVEIFPEFKEDKALHGDNSKEGDSGKLLFYAATIPIVAPVELVFGSRKCLLVFLLFTFEVSGADILGGEQSK